MKALLVAFFASAALQAAPVSAAAPESPLFGRWTLDTATLPMPPEMRPKRVTLSFDPVADGRIATQVLIVDQNDRAMTSESTLSLDGTPGRASGTYWVDVLAAKMPAPNVLVMQFVYEGVPRSTRVYSVSADGKVLTETEAYFKEDATPVMRTAQFTRVDGRP
ncbi:LuxR family transcriptional regulator [Pseudoxanthomonas putridarboris]|uniref:LuxR family transcriptional regulator n=1 Tax=Pseudoxanthomonas putridarboris TaxID=752605 RepID=A0ABU9IWT6_9GAMM